MLTRALIYTRAVSLASLHTHNFIPLGLVFTRDLSEA